MAGKRDPEGREQDPIILKNGIAVLTPDPIAEGAFGQVHVGKILNPMGLLAERIVWGEESPRWLGLDDIPYLENQRTGIPLPMIAPGQTRRVYEAAERLWRDYLERRRVDRPKADEEFRDLLNLIDPMLHEDRVIAVKVLRAPTSADPRPDGGPSEMERRFIKENDLLRALRHPGIVRRFGLVRDETMGWCLLMEYVEGETLDVRQRALPGGRVPFAAAAEIIGQVADALAYVHEKGIAHRDLKPQNIMIRRDDGRAVLMDFGIGKWIDETHTARLTMSGVRVGTPRYMAPEQAVAEAPVGQPADVYQLSTILFELVTGRAAYADMEVTQIFEWLMDPARRHPSDVRDGAPGISREFESLIEVGRDKDAAKRWTIEEFRDRLRRLAAEAQFEGPATEPPRSRPEALELLRLTRMRRKEIAWEERQLEDRVRLIDLQARVKEAWALLERKSYLEARPAAESLAREAVGLSARHATLKAEIENLARAFERASARSEAESLLSLAEQHDGAGRYAETGEALDAAKGRVEVLPVEAYADVHARFRALSERYEARHRSFVDLLGTLRKSFVEKIQDRERELREAADAGRPPAIERIEELAGQLAGAEKNLHAIERDQAGPSAYDGVQRDLILLREALDSLRRRAAAPTP
ncbi:MAG TPA: protein kinase [Planctomycetota bacterium]